MKDRFNFYLALSFFGMVALLGGASRADALSQTPLRLIAIVFLLVGLWAPNRVRMARYRTLFVFVGLAALIPALQLAPLPYEVWSDLPGRGAFARIVGIVGLDHGWRPLSLTPGMTWNALLSLLVPLTMLVLAAQVPVERLSGVVVAVLAAALASLVLGHAQLAGGAQSTLRFYHITNADSMVGLFANRNHHSVLLALAIPILFALPAGWHQHETWRRMGLPLAILGVLVIAGTLLLAGSRAGLLAGAAAGIAGPLLYASMARAAHVHRGAKTPPAGFWGRFQIVRHPFAAPVFALAAIAGAAVAFASAPAMQRLLRTSAADEDRARLLDPLLEMARSTLPVGGGFGSFAELWPRFERVEMLRPVYLNHAHMDLIEIVSDGGLAALLLLVGFLVWWGRRSVRAWREPPSARLGANLGRLGSITTGIVLFASLVDYPLRTPLHMAVFVIGCVLLQRGGQSAHRAPG